MPDLAVHAFAGEKLRCVGSALSPNGLAFSSEGMLSLALLDRVLDVDEKSQQVTVQAGARVQEVRRPLEVMLKLHRASSLLAAGGSAVWHCVRGARAVLSINLSGPFWMRVKQVTVQAAAWDAEGLMMLFALVLLINCMACSRRSRARCMLVVNMEAHCL